MSFTCSCISLLKVWILSDWAEISSVVAAILVIRLFISSIDDKRLTIDSMLAFIFGTVFSACTLFCSISFLVVSASSLILPATTANPFPASPAPAASIDAFRLNRLVWLAISFISLFRYICYNLGNACGILCRKFICFCKFRHTRTKMSEFFNYIFKFFIM